MSQLTRRDFGKMAGTVATSLGLSGLGTSPLRAAAPDSVQPFDIMPYVHPELRPMVKPIMSMDTAPLNSATLAAFRRRTFSMPPLAAPAWVEQIIPGPTGAPDLRLFIVNAKPGGALRPAILHTHGGGFVAGDAKSGLRTLQEIALALDCVIVSVDYRLAPEVRFNESVEDNYAGLKWLYEHAEEIGGDRHRIALFGESAGGGHAALLAIAARDRGEIPLVYQALMYPMLDDRTGSTVRKPPQLGALIWTPEKNRFGWSSFLGIEAGSRRVPTAGVPARVSNLKGLPPTFIAVGSIDLFVDEDMEYAKRLVDSGVSTELHVIPGGCHGFDLIPTPTLGKTFRAILIHALKVGLGIAETANAAPAPAP